MSPRRGALVAAAAFVLALAAPAVRADVTVIGRYRLANGDTLTRASYYTSKRMRTTLPNGYEIVYDHAAQRVALIDHAQKRFWEGPRAEANDIAKRIRAARAESLSANATPEMYQRWSEVLSTLNDSTTFHRNGKSQTIAGYPCTEFVLISKPYLEQHRWIARGLDVADFSSEIEPVVLATIADPIGRGLAKLMLDNHDVDGLTLASSIRFKMLKQTGNTSWQAVRVTSGSIPETAWQMPEGYTAWEPPAQEAPTK